MARVPWCGSEVYEAAQAFAERCLVRDDSLRERGISEAELIRTALRYELLGAPAGQAERAQRRARLLAAMGTLDSSVYPSGYLDELRAGWRG